jgi:hypothetical protein
MKKTILSLSSAVFLVVLSACDTGNVQVGNGSPPQSAGATQGSTNGGSPGSQEPGTSSKGSAGEVYFERVIVGNGTPQSVIAISFTQTATKGENPWGVDLNGNQAFSETAPFIPTQLNVVYLYSSNVDTDVLLSTALESFQSHQIFSFPRVVTAFSLNSDQSKVAWLDKAGTLTVSDIASGKDETVDTSLVGKTTILTHVEWNSDDSFLLARADDGSALLYKSEAPKPVLLSNVNASSFSKDGTELAYFNASNKSVHILNLTSNKDTVAGTLESSVIHDFGWSSTASLTYWTLLASQAKELRIFVIASGTEITVASLTLPQFVQDGVVCPAWIGNKVYFGNYDSGNYVIEQTNLNKDAKGPIGMQTFATIPNGDLSEGLVCPKVAQ